VAELLLLYARRILENEAPGVVDRVRAYRAGYHPEERREIERGQGESFRVRELDLAVGHAILEPVQVSYYTQAREINDLRILHPVAHKQHGGAEPPWGRFGSHSR
jgi:ATP-dependent helicase YprA (DUF1998 family)